MRISHPREEGILESAKMLKVSFFVDPIELRDLFQSLSFFAFYNTSAPIHLSDAQVPNACVLEQYGRYWDMMISQEKLDRKVTASFALTLASTENALYAMPVGSSGLFLLRQVKPCIQMQHHQFIISEVDGSFHSGVCSQEAISWGLTFLFPQIYKDSKTKEFIELTKKSDDPERNLFDQLQLWVRNHTLPCKFAGYGFQSFRIGKKAKQHAESFLPLRDKKLILG